MEHGGVGVLGAQRVDVCVSLVTFTSHSRVLVVGSGGGHGPAAVHWDIGGASTMSLPR